MKTSSGNKQAILSGAKFCVAGVVVLLGGLFGAGCASDPKATCGAAPAATKCRVGVYDSRAVAAAFVFSEVWKATEDGKRTLALREEYEKARAAGDKKIQAELDDKAKRMMTKQAIDSQILLHKQVFSTAPIDDILEHIKGRLPEIQKIARVDAVVSKWDKPALAKYKGAQQVDVTMLLINEMRPATEQVMVAVDIMAQTPIPLEKAEKIDWTKE